ncbi:MAG: ABC transporter ATP-binding protein/permease [Clostridia bacterium]|nr:ABC transporter ATP-binding protein/permease [Clostridia bacterium]
MFGEFRKDGSIRQIIRLMSYMKKRIVLYLASLIGMALVFALFVNLFIAYKSKPLFDAAVEGNLEMVKTTAIEIGGLVLIACIISPFLAYGVFSCIQKTITEVRLLIFKQVEELPMSYYDKNHSGEIMSHFNNDLNVMEDVYFWPIFMTFVSIIMGAGAIVMMVHLNWILALFTILMGIVTSFLNSRFAKPMRVVSDAVQQNLGAISERLMDLLTGFYVIKMFDIGKILALRFKDRTNSLKEDTIKYSHVGACLEGTNYFLGNLTYMGILSLSVILIVNYDLSIGTAVACIQLHGAVSFMFGQLGNFISQTQWCLAGASRVFKLLDEAVEPERYTVNESSQIGMVKLHNVTFAYGEEKKVIDNINITVPAGKVAALVGSSGSGKSTIVKLLLGFYPPEAGDIVINNKSINRYTLTELRDLIAYVPQEAYLFQGTIEENIRMGRDNATRDEIIEAAKAAHAHEFITEMPDGYDTLVGERGSRLSGGQRQRIAIARALIKDSPILLFDEATSALDSESEYLVQKAVDELMKNRTVLIVAHRLSTIRHADIIYVMEEGRIVEKGTHSELLDKGGSYANLYKLQFSA